MPPHATPWLLSSPLKLKNNLRITNVENHKFLGILMLGKKLGSIINGKYTRF